MSRFAFLIAALSLGAASGCSTEVAQTAGIAPAGALDCQTAGGLRLPTSGAFGSGMERPSGLVGSAYGANEGPGLYVTARDAFRVTLNGELVVESQAAREPMFVPLSVLPGDNALSVVVAAKNGTPAALVELQELEKSYESDTSWKVSTAPESGYADAGFDDSSWPPATDFGGVGSLPGCDPGSPFPSGSDARWIGPALGSGQTAVFRKTIRIVPVGYGEATTGGADATPVVVSTWDELQAAATDSEAPAVILLAEGDHDFRVAAHDQPACPSVCTEDASKTRYDVLTEGETCAEALVTRTRSERLLDLGSNKTLVGLGRGALLRGVSFRFPGVENVIVRNIAVYDVNPELGEAGDAFTIEAANRLWLDHVTTKWISDDFTSIAAGTDGVTLSWVRYDGVSVSTCRGFHQLAAWVTDANATFHHCFFDHVESHAPRVQGSARADLFDNLFADNPSYAVASICGAEVLMKANSFQRVATPTERATCADDTALGRIDAPAGSNYYGEDVGDHHGGDGMEPHDDLSPPPYDYETDPPEEDRARVLERAGAGGPWRLPLRLE